MAESRKAPQAKSAGSRKQAQWVEQLSSQDLARKVAALEARIIDLHPADWVAAYLLLCMSHVFPAACLGGKRRYSGRPGSDGDVDTGICIEYPSSLIALPGTSVPSCGERAHYVTPSLPAGSLYYSDVEGLSLSRRDVKKIEEIGSCGGEEDQGVSVLEIFKRFELVGVPPQVNESLQAWAAGRRPFVLMTRVSGVEELLLMQGEGRRCVTCFCRAAELGREWSDHYTPFAAKDAVHFTLHDMQHGEKFVDPSLYCEQVGFFFNFRAVWQWFTSRETVETVVTLALRQDVAHVMSDMNCSCLQLLDFLLARWQEPATPPPTPPSVRPVHPVTTEYRPLESVSSGAVPLKLLPVLCMELGLTGFVWQGAAEELRREDSRDAVTPPPDFLVRDRRSILRLLLQQECTGKLEDDIETFIQMPTCSFGQDRHGMGQRVRDVFCDRGTALVSRLRGNAAAAEDFAQLPPKN